MLRKNLECIKKPFLTQLIFSGGPINTRSGLVEVAA